MDKRYNQRIWRKESRTPIVYVMQHMALLGIPYLAYITCIDLSSFQVLIMFRTVLSSSLHPSTWRFSKLLRKACNLVMGSKINESHEGLTQRMSNNTENENGRNRRWRANSSRNGLWECYITSLPNCFSSMFWTTSPFKLTK